MRRCLGLVGTGDNGTQSALAHTAQLALRVATLSDLPWHEEIKEETPRALIGGKIKPLEPFHALRAAISWVSARARKRQQTDGAAPDYERALRLSPQLFWEHQLLVEFAPVAAPAYADPMAAIVPRAQAVSASLRAVLDSQPVAAAVDAAAVRALVSIKGVVDVLRSAHLRALVVAAQEAEYWPDDEGDWWEEGGEEDKGDDNDPSSDDGSGDEEAGSSSGLGRQTEAAARARDALAAAAAAETAAKSAALQADDAAAAADAPADAAARRRLALALRSGASLSEAARALLELLTRTSGLYASLAGVVTSAAEALTAAAVAAAAAAPALVAAAEIASAAAAATGSQSALCPPLEHLLRVVDMLGGIGCARSHACQAFNVTEAMVYEAPMPPLPPTDRWLLEGGWEEEGRVAGLLAHVRAHGAAGSEGGRAGGKRLGGAGRRWLAGADALIAALAPAAQLP